MENPPNTPLLRATSLKKSFGGLRVINDMSLSLEAGGLLGVIGPNGAGKTTLFNLLAGSLPVDSGQVTLGGTDLTHSPAQARLAAGMGRTFQIPRPFPRMTLLENVLTAAQNQPGEALLPALLSPRRVAKVELENTARAHDILAFLSLAHLADQPASVLSGGQRKLLELGRVMMAGPRVILLDEPAAGVNPALLDLIIDRILAINAQGVAVLLIEHNMEMITRLCPRVIVMAAGAELASGTPAEVSARRDVIDVYLEGMPA